MKKSILFIFSIFTILFLLGCSFSKNERIRNKLIKKLEAYDQESIGFDSFEYSLSLEVKINIFKGQQAGKETSESQTEKIQFDLKNNIIKYNDCLYFEKENIVYEQSILPSKMVSTKTVTDFNVYDIAIMNYEDFLTKDAKYEKDKNVFRVTSKLTSLKNEQLEEVFNELYETTGLYAGKFDLEYTITFDDKNLDFKIETILFDGYDVEHSNYAITITVASKIYNVNEIELSLFDPEIYPYALCGTFENAKNLMYGLEEITENNKSFTKEIIKHDSKENYFPIKITEAGIYTIGCDLDSFKIYDSKCEIVSGNELKEGIYFICVRAEDKVKSVNFKISNINSDEFKDFNSAQKLDNNTIDINLKEDIQIYSYTSNKGGLYEFQFNDSNIVVDIYKKKNLYDIYESVSIKNNRVLLGKDINYYFVIHFIESTNETSQNILINFDQIAKVAPTYTKIEEGVSELYYMKFDTDSYNLSFEILEEGYYVLEVLNENGSLNNIIKGSLNEKNTNEIVNYITLSDGRKAYYLFEGVYIYSMYIPDIEDYIFVGKFNLELVQP